MLKLSEEKEALLKADFPPEALKDDNSRGFLLTSIKAAYVTERLTDVFGIGGWSYTFDPFVHIEGEICTVVYLTVSDEDGNTLTISQAGGKRIKQGKEKDGKPGVFHITDARKSAATDGLTKCASILGIGHTIFKGLGSSQGHTKPTDKPADEPKVQTPEVTLFTVDESDKLREDYMIRITNCADMDALRTFYGEYGIHIVRLQPADRQAVMEKKEIRKAELG